MVLFKAILAGGAYLAYRSHKNRKERRAVSDGAPEHHCRCNHRHQPEPYHDSPTLIPNDTQPINTSREVEKVPQVEYPAQQDYVVVEPPVYADEKSYPKDEKKMKM